jgi:hypothetical protein
MGELKQKKILFSVSEVMISQQLKLRKAECLSGCFHYVSEMAGGLVFRKTHGMYHLPTSTFIHRESCLSLASWNMEEPSAFTSSCYLIIASPLAES